ncbi:MAG: hypothetical protein EON88_34225 [Brevundimonas sp.]|nr:MAG: hypothetical protein EON88_34225 [Brevundimonas sp.]
MTDPTTGEARRISEEKPFEGQVEFTQDLPSLDLKWGLSVEHIAERKVEYRFDEIRRESEDLGFTVFVEREIRDAWRLRLEATDLFGRAFEETRTSYDGPRSVAVPASLETRRRETPGFASISLRRSF